MRFLKGKPPKTSPGFQNFRLRRFEKTQDMTYFPSRPPEADLDLKMRFLKGKSPRKELKLGFFRAAGAPIFGFLGHNPKFAKFS